MDRPISTLYELCSKQQLAAPKFRLIGQNAQNSFTVDCMAGDLHELGFGDTRYLARQNAALAVLKKLSTNGTEQTLEAESSNGVASRYETEFENHQFLGHGAFGVVFKAKSVVDGCDYALKLITIDNADELQRDKVLREVGFPLDHAHVVQYVDTWIEVVSSEKLKKRYRPHVLCAYFNTLVSGKSDSCTSDDSRGSVSSEQSSSDAFSRFTPGVHSPLSNLEVLDTPPSTAEVLVLHIQLQLCDRTLEDWIDEDNKRIFDTRKDNPDGPSRVELRDRSMVLNIYEQIVKAIRYIHGKGMMHRDLKPSNIYFARDGRIVVGDLGSLKPFNQFEKMSCLNDISESTNDADEDSSEIQSANLQNSQVPECHSANLGTVPYCAPETSSMADVTSYGKEVDIYSLGVILLQLLYPCTSRELCDVLRNLDSYNTGCPVMLQTADRELLKSMLFRIPNMRPSAAKLLASDPLVTHRRMKKQATTQRHD